MKHRHLVLPDYLLEMGVECEIYFEPIGYFDLDSTLTLQYIEKGTVDNFLNLLTIPEQLLIVYFKYFMHKEVNLRPILKNINDIRQLESLSSYLASVKSREGKT